ncbi:restriction endonuclease [Microcoleus sp. K1-B6]|uniref:Eco57I restriction-modification methylase domain-containing protein n=1 Tax=unclassified Microcoleus TaxID=2642155 RepID=UPI002FD406E7
MSTARHHAEWLSLVEASGPFLSLPVLLKVFPSGLDAHDSEHFKLLRLAYEEWQDNQLGARPEKAIHRAWVEFVLRQTLELPEEVLLEGQRIPPGLQTTVAQQGETLRPDWVIVNPQETPNAGRPRLLVQIVPAEQDLEKPLAGQRWKASPATRMMELLHAANVRLGLVTNGEHWMLVNAPRGETTGFISWYGTLWLEEHLTLRAFRSLLGVRRFFGVDDSEILETLLIQSISDQQEVTDQLGYQVRRAVEVLVQALDRIDQDRNRTLLQDISEPQLYEAALTVMMRLVFLFSAEERKLIPSAGGEALYHEYYAVSTISAKLRSDADKFGEEVLERRSDAWCRLLATFRAVHGGIRHDLLDIPAYGGSLFDPDRFPFLEGRGRGTRWQEISAEPIPVNNRIVLHLLEALQILQIRVGGTLEPRRLSFRALDIEQIGHVYEGLLDHTAVRATSPVLGLIGTREREPEVGLLELERLQAKGEEDFVKFVKEQSNKSPAALRKALSVVISPRVQERLRAACNNDGELYQRVLPFAGLIRLDTLEYPMVIPEGSVYVTQGSNRRETGTHYTPRSLTEPIVQYTLEPLVYEGVAEGKPKEQWRLKSATELLQLKVCDMAMGSGAFLVQTCRYLAERLVEAWEGLERENPGKVVIAPEGTLSKFRPDECPIPKDSDERLTVARRIVAERCLYGVDKNPLAVEMAKLSLWLITLAKARPFTFLDHAFKWGDSLVGVNLEQLRYWNLDTTGTPALFADKIRREVEQVIELRRQIAAKPGMTAQDQTEKAYLLAKANAVANDLRDGCDLLVASYFNDLSEVEREGLRQTLLTVFRDGASVSDRVRQVLPDLEKLRPFHWHLEFPEVFLDDSAPKGFAALVGNPPFQGGKKITGVLGTDYRDFLVERIAGGQKGVADLCAYFFLRAQQLLSSNGGFGLVATNTIAQGDTREVGLDQLVANGCAIPRAVSSRKWEGTASLEVSHVWLRKGKWQGKFILDEKPVDGITAFLTTPGKAIGKPHRLVANQDKSFQGSVVLGMGFVLTPEEAQALIEKDARNKDVLFPYLNGEDLNSRLDQSPSRWVINFKDWPLDAEHDDPKKPKGAPYAADYPNCLAIVEEKVKSQRDKVNKKVYRDKWWQFAERCPGLYDAITGCDRVLAVAATSQTLAFTFLANNSIFANTIYIFVIDSDDLLAVMMSSLNRAWTFEYCSNMRTDLRYSGSDAFETFPFPLLTSNLEKIGEKYYTHRQNIMQTRQEGLTKTYNCFHNRDETAADIQQLRELHVEMDNAVAAAYGWQDIDLGHDFHETKQGLRYTISETARREVLDRLLLLNHERYAEEVAQGLHDKGKKKGKSGGKTAKKQVSSEGQLSLF